jgi:predicted MPP superfamily phosphohydrolase
VNRRTFLRGITASALVGTLGTPLIARGIRTHDLEQRAIPLTLGLSRPFRLVALGDIHFDPLYEEAYLAHIADCVTNLKPDLIAYTGDFITGCVSRMKDLAAILSRSTSRLGSFATLGNHDHWNGARPVIFALEKAGIRVLRNESFAVPGEDGFFVTGLDSYWAGTPRPEILTRTPVQSRHVLLVHEPDPFAQLDDPRIKLQISGHTHGGQIRAPLIGALHLPKWGKNYQEGLYAQDGRYLYVNRGVGTLMPHVRYRCRPEISVFELS